MCIRDSPYVAPALTGYFPKVLQARYASAMLRQPLKREIIATVLTNSMINHVGIVFVFRMCDETGAQAHEVVRAYIPVSYTHLYEIWFYSPRVEGIHLRGGKVARGGLRWSDRMEDFRTEILGLVKAQMVKNVVIVPVGSKGGFVLKNPPPQTDREAYLNEGIECYKSFLRGLLDVTDNLVANELVPPKNVVRHDGDDPYLVVAADKGTATFSDLSLIHI